MIEWTIIHFLDYYDHFLIEIGDQNIQKSLACEIKWKIPGLAHKILHELRISIISLISHIHQTQTSKLQSHCLKPGPSSPHVWNVHPLPFR